MNRQSKDSFRNSSLGRAQTSKKRFHSFINDKFKRHRSDTGLVEDRANSSTIVRTIVGLLLIHLVFIGGVLVRGHLVKSGGGVALAPGMTPPTTTAEAPSQVIPTPPNAVSTGTPTVLPTLSPSPSVAQATTTVQPVVPTVPSNTATKPQPTVPHITQLPADEVAEEVTSEPAPVVKPTPARNTVMTKHRVASGDSWSRIAAQYNTTVEALKAANPKTAAKNVLYSGVYLDVPVAADSDIGRSVTATNQQEAAVAKGKTYVVKKGDSLGAIAKRNKISLKKLLELNNMTEADAKRLKIGTELKVAE